MRATMAAAASVAAVAPAIALSVGICLPTGSPEKTAPRLAGIRMQDGVRQSSTILTSTYTAWSPQGTPTRPSQHHVAQAGGTRNSPTDPHL